MKTYKFYRNFAILCGFLFVLATAMFIIGMVKFLYLNPYSDSDCNFLRAFLTGIMVFQLYMVYMIIGSYKKWRKAIRYQSFLRQARRTDRKNTEYSAFIKEYFN